MSVVLSVTEIIAALLVFNIADYVPEEALGVLIFGIVCLFVLNILFMVLYYCTVTRKLNMDL